MNQVLKRILSLQDVFLTERTSITSIFISLDQSWVLESSCNRVLSSYPRNLTFCFLVCLVFLCLSAAWSPEFLMLFSITPFWGAAAVSGPAFFFLLRDPVPPPLAMVVCVLQYLQGSETFSNQFHEKLKSIGQCTRNSILKV